LRVVRTALEAEGEDAGPDAFDEGLDD
jgi:hypothetical protein